LIRLVFSSLSFIASSVTDETNSFIRDRWNWAVHPWPMKLSLVSSVTDEMLSFIVTDETNTLTFIFGRELSRYSHSFHSLRLVSDESYAVRTR
jgi:hypothetical protein